MDLLTIGAFARACRLSPKALRLYDELGLLPPARVDPASGYRFYRPAQLERARLVAWLRRLGMPLARIRVVCDRYDRDAGAAADEIAAYWDQVVADTATRQRLAAFLVDYLSELKPLEAGIPAGDLLNALQEAVDDADRALHGIASSVSGGVGTTLTAMVWAGSQLALVHIGDTRAHLLRGGELFQITHDHSYVQSLVDSGSLTPDEAASHPQRAMLIRALDGKGSPRPDLSLHDAQAGDRYLLCSDGLSAVVATEAIRTALTMITDPEQVVQQLIDLAYQVGAPDNIACVVADVVSL